MTLDSLNRTFVGVSSLVIKRKSDNTVLNWPIPSTFNLDIGIEQRVQESRNNQARKVRASSYVAGEQPTLSISYSQIQPEMIGFSVGNQLATGTFATYIPKVLQVTKASYPASTTGFLFFGVAADEALATASYTKDGVSTKLTREVFATFDGETDDTYAVGDDGAVKFSDNLVSGQQVVTYLVPSDVTGLRISDVLVGTHEVYATMVDTLNQVSIFEAYAATPNLEGRSIDFGGEGGLEISLFLNNPPGECRAWNLISLTDKVACI